MTPAKYIESDLALESGQALQRLLADQVDCSNWRVHAGADRAPLERALVGGEWDRIGCREQGLDTLDLCHIAEVWGRFLVPLPLLPALMAHRWELPAAARVQGSLLTLALPVRQGGSVVPHGNAGHPVLDDAGIVGDAGRGTAWRIDEADLVMPLCYCGMNGIALAPLLRELYALYAAEAIGAAAMALQKAMDHAAQRRAFGQTIVGFQALRHRLADMYKDLEIARGSLVRAACEPEVAQAAAAFVFQRCRSVVEGAIQVHGGMGFTWDSGLHFHLRHVLGLGDVVALTLPGGGAAFAPVAGA